MSGASGTPGELRPPRRDRRFILIVLLAGLQIAPLVIVGIAVLLTPCSDFCMSPLGLVPLGIGVAFLVALILWATDVTGWPLYLVEAFLAFYALAAVILNAGQRAEAGRAFDAGELALGVAIALIPLSVLVLEWSRLRSIESEEESA